MKAQQQAEYTISVGDELQLDFLDDQAGPFVMIVGNDGAVQLPYLGTLVLSGEHLAQARRIIADAYVAQEILVAPRIEVSIINLRPFSVLGDVQTPGFFDYRAGLSVETAIGLAGGPIRIPGGEEARASQRIILRADLARIDAAILREAIATARLQTQLAGGVTIDPAIVQSDGQRDNDLIATLIAQDNTIIAAERAQFEAERSLIEQAITESSLQIALTEDQIDAQAAQIQSYDAELASAAELVDRGLMAMPVRARIVRQVADEEAALLRLRTNLAAIRRDRMGLMREELGLEFRRAQAWRLELTAISIRDAQFNADRASVLDRILLLENWARRLADTDAGVTLSYVIRRQGANGETVTIDAQATDPVHPGDVIILHSVLGGLDQVVGQ